MLPLVAALFLVPLLSPPVAPAPVAAAQEEAPEARAARAQAAEERGDLPSAREDYLAAAVRFPVGADREDAMARARAIAARLALRAEIAAALVRDARVFGELGFERADDAGVTFQGKPKAWSEVPLDALGRAAAAARASSEARVGLVQERVQRGSETERKSALADLAELVAKGDLAAPDAWHAVARVRGERVPAKGYVYRGGQWSDVLALEQKAAASGFEALVLAVETAASADRDAALAALRALGPAGEARVRAALDARFARASGVLADACSGPLGALAEARKELDRAREHALALIFDEETYFYPYHPPECPPERAKLYAGVQNDVNERVSVVRKLWNAKRSVSITADVREALDELSWNRAVRPLAKERPALPAEVPAWVEGLDPAAKKVDLATFAWDAKERSALELDRALLELNAKRVKEKAAKPAAAVNSEEAKQVEITNEYRRMLGRRVLAWNPKIQDAAQGHSDYMSLTGDFGHFEKDPARKGPVERLKLAGYTFGGGENCAMGGFGPEGAHSGWTQSSGHHRNLLGPKHREMASAISGPYWTQNFGAGNEYEALLPARASTPDAKPR